ncbi:3179_t:CDS:2, partial [Entrophospora sp. SA101]
MNFTIHEGITGEDLFWDMPNPNPKNQLSNNSKNPNDQSTSKIYQDNQTDTNKNPEDTNIDNITSSEITDDLMSDNETIEYDTSSIDTNQEETDHNLIIIQLDLFNKLIKIEKKEKDNVFKMIKIKLGWAYFNQIGWKNINHSDTIRKLQYIAGFIGKKQNFKYNKINLALRDILKEEFPDLPSHPNLIDKSIKVKIPYKLP